MAFSGTYRRRPTHKPTTRPRINDAREIARPRPMVDDSDNLMAYRANCSENGVPEWHSRVRRFDAAWFHRLKFPVVLIRLSGGASNSPMGHIRQASVTAGIALALCFDIDPG